MPDSWRELRLIQPSAIPDVFRSTWSIAVSERTALNGFTQLLDIYFTRLT